MSDPLVRGTPDFSRLSRRVSLALGAYALVAGLLSLLGYVLDIPRLANWGNNIAIQPNTTVAAMLSGIAVILLGLNLRSAAAAVGIMAGVIGAATLFEHVTRVDLGIDRLLTFDRTWGDTAVLAPGRMGPSAATSFVILALALSFAGSLRRRRRAPMLGLLVAGWALLSLTGHAFGASALYTVPRYTAISLQTATMLFALGLGVVAALPGEGPSALLVEDSAAGQLVRRALPFIVAMPIALGLALLSGSEAGFYDIQMSSAVLTFLLSILLVRLLWWGAKIVQVREREQHRAEVALKDADRRKDEFLATLAHELRNPLAPIRNALEILRRPADGDTRDRLLDTMDRQSTHLVRLVDDLLDVARATRGEVPLQKTRVELKSALGSAIEANRAYIDGAKQALSVSIPQESLPLHADPVRLTQIFGNLLNNASKYAGRGGRIGITAVRRGDRVSVSVRDGGMGIAPAMLPHVFDMFWRGEASGESSGLGIGLALARTLVTLHGGYIEARSDGPGTGTEFVVDLPLDTRASQAVPATPVSLPSSRQRVLIVDDNRDAADTLGTLLALSGAETRTAYAGTDALEAAKTFSPTVAILDIGMPGMNGHELAERIREKWPEVKLIALTGWGQEEDRQKSRDAGFDHHFTKPVKPQALFELLSTLDGS